MDSNPTNGNVTSEHLEDVIKTVKDFRKEIDALIQKSEDILCIGGNETTQVWNEIKTNAGREVALVRTKLQEAKMWAGKILEVMGNPFPPELADKADK